MKLSVLGAGAWGTALAIVLAERGHEVLLWSWQAEHAEAMATARENEAFFAGHRFPSGLGVTGELQDAALGAELLFVVVPSQAVRGTLAQIAPFYSASVPVVLASKGIEQGTLALLSSVVGDVLGKEAEERSVALSGPSFAAEVARHVPTNLVAASMVPSAASLVQEACATDWLRVYTSSDPIGVELGGALKNVIAIAAGACDGLGLGHNTRAALMTRGIAEMGRLAVRMGGSQLTLAGLAGLGDLILTCTGELSRNRELGLKLGSGRSLEQALAESRGIAEGHATAKSAFELAQRLGVDMPITEAVHSVLYLGQSPQAALATLLKRPLHAEWE